MTRGAQPCGSTHPPPALERAHDLQHCSGLAGAGDAAHVQALAAIWSRKRRGACILSIQLGASMTRTPATGCTFPCCPPRPDHEQAYRHAARPEVRAGRGQQGERRAKGAAGAPTLIQHLLHKLQDLRPLALPARQRAGHSREGQHAARLHARGPPHQTRGSSAGTRQQPCLRSQAHRSWARRHGKEATAAGWQLGTQPGARPAMEARHPPG